MTQQPLVGQGLLIIETSLSHLIDSSGRVISPSHRPVCPTTHNTHKRQPSISQAGFEPIIPAGEWPQTHA